MDFSIVVPSFNHAEFLARCLDSVLEQVGGEISVELVVMDGGSRDGTLALLESYDERLTYWVSQPDKGQSDALARGFARTTGDIMGYVNSDDLLLPGALTHAADAFCRYPEADVVYGDMILADRSGRPYRIKREIDFDLSILLWDYCYLPQPATFWRRSIWDRAGGIDPELQCAMDYDLWLRFVKAGARFRHIDVPLAAMRMYPEQKNQRLRAISDAEDHRLREKFLGRRITAAEARLRRAQQKIRRVVMKAVTGKYVGVKAAGKIEA